MDSRFVKSLKRIIKIICKKNNKLLNKTVKVITPIKIKTWIETKI